MKNLVNSLKKNKAFLEQKIVQNFLKEEKNRKLLLDAICNPTVENNIALDHEFKKYNFNARFISYISSTLYFNAINFDKKYRKYSERFKLIMDKPIKEGEQTTLKDSLEDATSHLDLEDIISSINIEDYIECPVLFKAVTKLSNKQKQIINLHYLKGYSITEIGKLLKKSQQSVSKLHQKALNEIYDYIKKNGGI